MSATGKNHGWPERLHAYSDRSGGPDACWPWIGAKVSKGYGSCLGPDGLIRSAHRLVYEYEVGPIPEGLTIDHLCRNRACVNPAHLEPVTNAENMRRASTEALMWCSRGGHPLNGPEDLMSQGHTRVCRACRYAYMREYRRKRREAHSPPSAS